MFDCQFKSIQHGFQLDVTLQSTQAILGIVGHSGVGKTTLLKHILGLYTPQQGHLRIHQKLLFDAATAHNIACQQRRIGMIFQTPCLFPHLNVRQNLNYALRWQTTRSMINPEQVIDVLQLNNLLKRPVHALSGGEAQRVAIGRALMAEPELLLLDEPFTGLHAELRAQCMYYLKSIQSQWKIPMLYVTHHLEELEQLNAKVVHMQQGYIDYGES